MALELDINLRKKIEKLRASERDVRIWRRLSALLWITDGVSVEEVGLRLTSRQVRKWLKIFRTRGLDALCQLQDQGRSCQLTDAQIEDLNSQQIIDWICKRFGVKYSSNGVKELLKRINVSYHKVSGFLWKADPVEQEEWLDDYRCDPVGTNIRRYFVDACHPVWGSSCCSTAGCWSASVSTSKWEADASG